MADFRGLTCDLTNLHRLLTGLVTPLGLQASAEGRFRGALFGRDSLQMALDVLPWLPALAENAIFSLAHLQGDHHDQLSEEEPGRIHHEYRCAYVGWQAVDRTQLAILRKLQRLWGGTGSDVVYYGSVDATPQFVRLVAEVVARTGTRLLDTTFLHKSGKELPLAGAVRQAACWIESRIEGSDIGLLEFRRTNPNGHRYQVLRDGVTSYFHGDTGELANSSAPIASLEVQGYAFDALVDAADLLQAAAPADAERWRTRARRLRASMLEHFWSPEHEAFLMAVDRDGAGRPRRLHTLSSNAAELLQTRVFDDLDEADRRRYVEAVVGLMSGPEFRTDAGIRCLALRYADLLPYWDYQGSMATWITVSNSFARGLRRQGFEALAVDQENRYLNAINIAEAFPEFLYVDRDGRVDYAGRGGQVTVPVAELPQRAQGWTVSAALRAVLQRRTQETVPAGVTPLLDRTQVAQVRRESPDIRLDPVLGKQVMHRYWRSRGVRLYTEEDMAMSTEE